MRPLFFVIVLNLAGSSVCAKSKVAFNESISVQIELKGNLSEEFSLEGPLGAEIEAVSSKPNSVCTARATFRRALYRSRAAIELWLTLDCTLEGQKRRYKPHRIFLDPAIDVQNIRLPMLAKNLKDVRLEIRDLSLGKSK